MPFSERISRLKSSLIREILAAAQRPEVMSFAGGLPAEPMLPKVQWEQMPASMGQYGMSEGEPALREAIAAEARALGVPCEASQVLIVSGSQQTLDLASKLFIDPGTEVLLEAPTYLAALQAFQLFGADCVTVPLGAEGPDLVALRQRLERHKPAFAYLIPTFQNPSGVRYSEERRDAVAALLDEFGVTLIEDEPYRELVFDEGRATPLVSRLRKSSWIYTGTVSKTLLPGLRVGFLIATPDLFPHLLRLKQSADLHTNRVGQWQALQWFGSEAYRQHLAELREFYRVRRDAMQEALLEHFGEPGRMEYPGGRAVLLADPQAAAGYPHPAPAGAGRRCRIHARRTFLRRAGAEPRASAAELQPRRPGAPARRPAAPGQGRPRRPGRRSGLNPHRRSSRGAGHPIRGATRCTRSTVITVRATATRSSWPCRCSASTTSGYRWTFSRARPRPRSSWRRTPTARYRCWSLEDGSCLWESNAILNFLADGSALLPSEPRLRTQVLQWQFFEQYSHEPYVAVARFIKLYLGLPEARRAEFEEKKIGGYKALDVMEKQLSRTPFLVGEQFSIADITLYAYTHVAHEGGFDLTAYPAIRAWIKRVGEVPGYVGMLD